MNSQYQTSLRVYIDDHLGLNLRNIENVPVGTKTRWGTYDGMTMVDSNFYHLFTNGRSSDDVITIATTARVSPDAQLAPGVFIGPKARVNADQVIVRNQIIVATTPQIHTGFESYQPSEVTDVTDSSIVQFEESEESTTQSAPQFAPPILPPAQHYSTDNAYVAPAEQTPNTTSDSNNSPATYTTEHIDSDITYSADVSPNPAAARPNRVRSDAPRRYTRQPRQFVVEYQRPR